MAQKVLYQGDNVSNGPSGNIWHDCHWVESLADPGIGYGFHEEFNHFGDPGTLTSIKEFDGYTVFAGATGLIVNTEVLGGELNLLTSASNEATVIGRDPVYNITSLGGALWFEARIKVSTVTTNLLGFFVGLMDTTAYTPTIPLTATSDLGDVNLVGFHRPEANTTAMDTSYKANSVTAVEVNSNVGTLVADTYVKLGLKFTPSDAGAATLRFYIDNVLQANKKTIPNATGTDFPADVRMGPVFAVQGVSTPDHSMTIDWWRCFQNRV